jgi:hypothetical protein
LLGLAAALRTASRSGGSTNRTKWPVEPLSAPGVDAPRR